MKQEKIIVTLTLIVLIIILIYINTISYQAIKEEIKEKEASACNYTLSQKVTATEKETTFPIQNLEKETKEIAMEDDYNENDIGDED